MKLNSTPHIKVGKKNPQVVNHGSKSALVIGPKPPLKLSGGAQVQKNMGGTSIRDVAESIAAAQVVLCPRLHASNVQFISHICCLCFI